MNPRTLRAGGAGLLIRYTTAPSPLGRMLAAATDAGVCAILFGRDDADSSPTCASASTKLSSSPPRATPDGSPRPLPSSSARPPSIPWPLPSRSTSAPPPSSSASGSALHNPARPDAQLLRPCPRSGQTHRRPRRCRSLCRQPVALAVPCHRAVGADGSLTGYRWGTPAQTENPRRRSPQHVNSSCEFGCPIHSALFAEWVGYRLR